jgi:hypothetical protein
MVEWCQFRMVAMVQKDQKTVFGYPKISLTWHSPSI